MWQVCSLKERLQERWFEVDVVDSVENSIVEVV